MNISKYRRFSGWKGGLAVICSIILLITIGCTGECYHYNITNNSTHGIGIYLCTYTSGPSYTMVAHERFWLGSGENEIFIFDSPGYHYTDDNTYIIMVDYAYNYQGALLPSSHYWIGDLIRMAVLVIEYDKEWLVRNNYKIEYPFNGDSTITYVRGLGNLTELGYDGYFGPNLPSRKKTE